MKHIPLTLSVLLILCLSAPVLSAKEKKPEKKLIRQTEVSFSNASGNSDTETVGLKLNLKDSRQEYKPFFRAQFLQSQDNGEESANKFDSRAGVSRDISSRAHTQFRGDALIDRFAGYNLRSSLHLGLGYKLLKVETQTLTSDLAGLYNYDRLSVPDEESVGPEHTDNYTSGRFSMVYNWKVNGHLDLEQEMQYSKELGSSRDRDFFDSETSLKIAMNGRMSLGLSYTVNYQETPPAEDIEKTDKTFMTALVWDL